MVHPPVAQAGASILIVDDTPTNRFVLRAALERAGHTVEEADSGEQCLQICADRPPSIILLDFVMPGIDGIETCRRLRQRFGRAHLPILMVTSVAESEKLAEAFEAGASDYVTKPIDRTILLARVASQLELQRSHRELEQALEVQRLVGEMLPQAIVVQSDSGDVVYSNSKVPSMLRGLSVPELFAQLHGGIAAEAYERAFSQIEADSCCDIDFEVKQEVGAVRALEVTSRAVTLVEGRLLRLWVWRDLTATRDLERKLNERVRLDMVSLFVGGVAHNFNNMLMTVAGAAEMLTRSVPDNPRAKRLLDIILEGTSAATRFTRKMNVFTRPELEAGTGRGESVEQVVQAALVPLEEEFGERVHFDVSIADKIPETSMSLVHVSEVIVNLLRNAAEAIKEKGLVSVALSHPPESEYIILVVADNGVGMSAGTLARVFEPFFSTKNLDERNSVSMRGNGLGLWNVYNLVKLGGGDVSVESASGHGSVVTVMLPVKPFTNH